MKGSSRVPEFIRADPSFLKPEDMVISGLYMTIPDLSAVVV